MDSSVWPRSTTSTPIGGNTGNVIDFKLPPPGSSRVRRPYEFSSEEYKAKLRRALELLYKPNLPLTGSISRSPHARFGNTFILFHRIYLFVVEKIIANLTDDSNFALPYYSWDGPNFPLSPDSVFLFSSDSDLPSFTVIDLNHDFNNSTFTPPVSEIIANNLAIMYRHIVSGAKTPKLFFGSPYRAADGDNEAEPGRGTIENLLHTPLHYLSYGAYQPDEESRNFDTADRDAAFYAILTNADRLWTIWEFIHGQKRTEFTDSNLLDASFVLYDENAQLVRAKVRDCLDPLKLRYTYQEIPIPWLDSRPKPKAKSTGGVSSKSSAELPITTMIGTGDFPRTLNSVITVEVPRPRKSRSLKEKEDEEEVLLIRGIEVDPDAFVKFDVYINDEDYSVTSPIHTEFAGSFTNSPYMHIQGMTEKNKKTCWRLGINETLEDLGAEDDDILIVTIVPRAGTVAIGGIEIEFLSD